MRRCALFLALALAFETVTLGAISITPAQPTRFDSIRATVSTWAPASNYGAEPIRVSRDGNEIVLDVTWSAPGAGLTVMTLREQTAYIGSLAPGTYTIIANHQGALNFTESSSFTVGGGTSWPSSFNPFATIGSRFDNLWNGFSHPGSPTQDCLCQRYPDLFKGEYCPFCGRRLSWPASIPRIDVVLVPIDEP